ncbi:MAG: ATP-binding protein [bacterium]
MLEKFFTKSEKINNENLNNYTNQLQSLEKISSLLVSSLPLDSILENITQLLPSALGISFASILLWDTNNENFKVAKNSIPKKVAKIIETALHKVDGFSYPGNTDENLFKNSMKQKAVLTTENIYAMLIPVTGENYAKAVISLIKSQIKLLVSAPLIINNEAIGVLALGWKKSEFTQHDKEAVQTFTNQTAIAIQNTRLYQQIQEQLVEKKQQFQDLQALQRVSNYITSTLDFSELPQKIVDIIPDQLGKDYVGGVFAYKENDNANFYRLSSMTNTPQIKEAQKFLNLSINDYIYNFSDDIETLSNLHQHVIVSRTHYISDNFRDFAPSSIKTATLNAVKKLLNLGGIGSIPIILHDVVIGFLFFAFRIPAKAINERHINMMKAFADQIAITIGNARLYETSIQQNQDLQTIQNITNYITASLDIEEICQKIADAIPQQLGTENGYIGGFIALKETNTSILKAWAVSETPTITKALKLLPKDFKTYSIDIQKEQRKSKMLQKIFGEKQYFISDKVADVVSPPAPKVLCPPIQQIVGIKSTAAFPVIFNDEVVGMIEFIFNTPKETIDHRKIRMMQSFADQVALAINNANMFNNLKKATEDLQKAYAELQELDKAKTEFVSLASHQLRTPLSIIRGYVSMMKEGDYGELPERISHSLLKTQENIDRLINIVDDLLNVAHIEAGKLVMNFQKEDLNDIISEITEQLRPQAEEHKLYLNITLPKTKLPTLTLDRQKITEVISNLIDNAIHYTPKGGISLSLEISPDDHIVIKVQDTGIGLPKEYRKDLFTKFARAENARKIRPDGSGIGLYLAKNIIEAHQGTISADSSLGKGTTFTIKLPIKFQPTSPTTRTPLLKNN